MSKNEKELYRKAYWDFLEVTSETIEKYITTNTIESINEKADSTSNIKVLKGLIISEIHNKMMEHIKEQEK